MTSEMFKGLVRLTFRDPEEAAHLLLSQGWPMSVRWMALLLAVSVSGLLAFISAQLFPVPRETATPAFALSQQPLVLAGFQFAAIVVGAWLMAGVGRMFGGHGRFEDALLLAVWIEVILLIVQVVRSSCRWSCRAWGRSWGSSASPCSCG